MFFCAEKKEKFFHYISFSNRLHATNHETIEKKSYIELFFLSFINFPFLFPMKHLQHSLVSEIRDLIYPEDRLRFDELMFRHGITVNVGYIDYFP